MTAKDEAIDKLAEQLWKTLHEDWVLFPSWASVTESVRVNFTRQATLVYELIDAGVEQAKEDERQRINKKLRHWTKLGGGVARLVEKNIDYFTNPE